WSLTFTCAQLAEAYGKTPFKKFLQKFSAIFIRVPNNCVALSKSVLEAQPIARADHISQLEQRYAARVVALLSQHDSVGIGDIPSVYNLGMPLEVRRFASDSNEHS